MAFPPHLTLPSGSRSPWHCRHRRPVLGLGVVLSLLRPSCPASRQTCLTSARTTDSVSIQLFSRKSILRKVSDSTVGTAPSPEPSPTHALWTRGWGGAGAGRVPATCVPLLTLLSGAQTVM